MRRLPGVLFLALLGIFPHSATAQVQIRPAPPPVAVPPVQLPAPVVTPPVILQPTAPPAAAMPIQNLEPPEPIALPAQNVLRSETATAPPAPPPAASPPDGGDASACDCYVIENVPIVNGAEVTYQSNRRLTGRSAQCCPPQ